MKGSQPAFNSLANASGLHFWSSLLRRWTALLGIVLVASTWHLWTLQSQFPAIPALQILCDVPLVVDWLCLALFLIGLGTVVASSGRVAEMGSCAALVAGLLLIGLNQHRFQPWVYQLLLFLGILRLRDERATRQLLTWLVISIYFYSAIGKLDYEFLHTVGQQFWRGLLTLLKAGGDERQTMPIACIALLPLGELLIATGLAFRPTRRWTGAVACGFHLLLVMILGPMGLDHSAGVVIWNLQFAIQALLLFVVPETRGERLESPREWSWGRRLATVIVGLAIGLPLAERWGYWDHWPSWALYAPHSSRADVWAARSAVERLPVSLQRQLDLDEEMALWIRLPIDRWSLAQTGAPIYPQARFQLGVAIDLAQRLDSEFEIKVVLQSVANRFIGKRASRELEGVTRIESANDLHWLNAHPRKWPTAGTQYAAR